MAVLTVDEFKAILRTDPPEQVVRERVFSGDVFLAETFPQVLGTLRRNLCPQFGLRDEDVFIVGSAKMGFSLDPDKFPAAFKKKGGDVDVVVISEELFDRFWEVFLAWHYPRRSSGLTSAADREWISLRRKNLYWGWFVPSEIQYTGLSLPAVLKPIRDLKTKWFSAFRALSAQPAFLGRDVNGRLYRTWNHALWYHAYGLSEIKTKLI